MTKLSGYELSRAWFDFSFTNPELINPNHSALYFFAIEHCNRLGWKSKFGLPTTMAMEAIGIKSYKTYKKTLTDLIEWGFIVMVQKSTNQYSANVIALVKNTKAQTKALDKAMAKHTTKQGEYIKTIEPLTLEQDVTPSNKKFIKPTFEQVKAYCIERKNTIDPQQFIDYYDARGWMLNKVKMKDWKAAVRTWEKNQTKTDKPNLIDKWKNYQTGTKL